MGNTKQENPLPLPVHEPYRGNFMYALMKALEKDQNSLSQSQINQAEAAKIAGTVYLHIEQYWGAKCATDAKNASWFASKGGRKDKHWKDKVTQWEQQYNEDNANGQCQEANAQAPVTSSQQTISSVASDLQTKAQMAQGVNSILATLSALLGRITA